MKDKVKIFLSYSHRDEAHRLSLETHLSILKRQGLILDWNDRKIPPGKSWESEIDKNLNEADIIILLVSPDFIASDYCYGKEMKLALDRYKEGRSYVVPVIVRPVDWAVEPLGKLQALPKDGKPVTTWDNCDEAWQDIIRGIRIIVDHVIKNRTETEEEVTPVFHSMSNLVKDAFREIESLYSDDKTLHGTPSGFWQLDQLIDGIHSTDIVLLAGQPTVGKSNLALCVASFFALEQGIPVAFYSMRLTKEVATRRLLSSTSKVPISNIARALLVEQAWPKLTHAACRLSEAPLFIYENSNILTEDLYKQIGLLKNECGLGLVIVDGIEHISLNSRSSDQKAEIFEIVKSIKTISRDYRVPILLTLHTARASDRRVGKRPIISDLEGWGILASGTANVVMMIYRDDIYDKSKDNPNRGVAEIIIVKNDYGPSKIVKLAYLERYCSFENLAAVEKNDG
jgi:replicative DNA helicase